VAALLRPGGRIFVRDGHPMMYTLPDRLPLSFTLHGVKE
jgi:hypothetical protein